MQYKRISADCHLDMPWMPPDLFTSMASSEMKDRMPFVVDTDDGPKWTAKNGASFGYKNGVGPAGSKYVPGKHHRVDVMAETGLYSDGAKDIRRVSDPHLRIKDLDRDGVDAEVIYGILGASSRLNDTDASNEMLRIYNDWLKGFCSYYPDRHIGLACLPYGDIDAAVQETLSRRQVGPARAGALLLVGHGADVASDVGALVEGGERRAASPALPHLPHAAAQHHREAWRPGRTLGVLHRRVGLPDEPGEHPGRHHRRQRAGALSPHPHRLRRERLRLDPLRARPHGFRMGGPLHRPRPEDEALRLLAPPVQGHVPVRPHRRQADRRHGRGEPDVGLRLSARRRRVAALGQVHQGAVRRGLAGGDQDDHLHQRRQVLRADQLGPQTASA